MNQPSKDQLYVCMTGTIDNASTKHLATLSSSVKTFVLLIVLNNYNYASILIKKETNHDWLTNNFLSLSASSPKRASVIASMSVFHVMDTPAT